MTKARDIADSELGSLTVDTDTLVVDETNNRVGIGTSSPSEALEVNGTSNATNLTRGGSQVYSRDNILGTVSESSGVPTGAIIERGSNSNGEYVKYADGTMICSDFTFINETFSSGSYTRTVIYPASFISDNHIFIGFPSFQVATEANKLVYLSTRTSGGTDRTNGTIDVFFEFSSGLNFKFRPNYIAIGRWF